MANVLFHDVSVSVADSAATSTLFTLLDFSDTTTGANIDYYDRKTVTLAASATGVDLFPTGIPTITTGKLFVCIQPVYDSSSALADRHTIINVDGSAVDTNITFPFGAVGVTTALTADNPDSTYTQVLNITFAHVTS